MFVQQWSGYADHNALQCIEICAEFVFNDIVFILHFMTIYNAELLVEVQHSVSI
jgi:hypothetical protein